MDVINQSELHQFARRHANARKPLSSWLQVATTAAWKSMADLKNTFRSADYVKDMVIFNIGGNNFRLIASVDFASQRIYVLEIMTHSEYDEWKV